jgi:hypothetical protein
VEMPRRSRHAGRGHAKRQPADYDLYSKTGPFTGGSGGGGVRSPDKPIADAGLRRDAARFHPPMCIFLEQPKV